MAPKAMPRTFTKMSSEEIRLAQMWFEHDAKKPAEIAELLHRNKSTITRHCVKLVVKKKQGRKPALSEAQKDQLVKKVEYMIKKAKGEWRVTADMVRKTLRLKVSTKCVLGALHSRGIYFRAMRQKPLLTEQDIMDRHQFAKTYARKTKQWWLHHIQLTIDVKYFRVYLDKEARSRAAKEGTWGAFRQKGQGLDAPYVRPSKRLKWNPGARGVHVLAGVGNGRVLVWRYLDSKKKVMWSGRTAAECYRGPIQKALEKHYPMRPRWNILEDNDPTGFRSRAGLAAKTDVGITTFTIPKRSPQLNVCDYAVWTEVERRMRRQEQKFSSGKRESRADFMERLRRTALRLPARFINESIMGMRLRCQRLLAAKGGHIEEGPK